MGDTPRLCWRSQLVVLLGAFTAAPFAIEITFCIWPSSSGFVCGLAFKRGIHDDKVWKYHCAQQCRFAHVAFHTYVFETLLRNRIE